MGALSLCLAWQKFCAKLIAENHRLHARVKQLETIIAEAKEMVEQLKKP